VKDYDELPLSSEEIAVRMGCLTLITRILVIVVSILTTILLFGTAYFFIFG